jgi:hypothetical protein
MFHRTIKQARLFIDAEKLFKIIPSIRLAES